jgi:hypothetical protein
MVLEWTETEPGTWRAPGINGYIREVGPGDFEVCLGNGHCIAHAESLKEVQYKEITFILQQGGMYEPPRSQESQDRLL